MRKIMIAVCDTDTAYGERLGEWISLENAQRLTGMFYSAWECFQESFNSQMPDIVLLGKGFLEDPRVRERILWQKETEEGENQGKEQEPFWLYLIGDEIQESLFVKGVPAVKKYQSASCILREVFTHYQNWGKGRRIETAAEKEIIGVYSPGHSVWQTPFTLTFAQALSHKEKVLYVNLKECAGFSGWFNEEYEKDLLDVMYLCLTNEMNVSDCVNSALYTMEGIDYIPPAEDGGCLAEISSQDYLTFIKLLAAKSGYDVILMDFGMMVPGFYKILETCSRVYIVTEPGEIQNAPLQHFQQMTERQEDIQLEKKLVYLPLPSMAQELCTGTARLQQWLWGRMGDFSRGLAGVQRGAD